VYYSESLDAVAVYSSDASAPVSASYSVDVSSGDDCTFVFNAWSSSPEALEASVTSGGSHEATVPPDATGWVTGRAGFTAGAATAALSVGATGGSAAVAYVRLGLVEGTARYDGPWFDGNLPDSMGVSHQWEGVPDASVSHRLRHDWSKADGVEWGLWLKSRRFPDLITRVEWEGIGDVTSDTQGAVYQVYGGPGIGQFGGVAPEEFTITAWVD